VKLTVIIIFFLFMRFGGYSQIVTLSDSTVRQSEKHNSVKTKSTFFVFGKIKGFKTGYLKVFTRDKRIDLKTPILNGMFYFEGLVGVEPEYVSLQIDGDYYLNSCIIDSGIINIFWEFQKSISAHGTRENDMRNYFIDDLASKNWKGLSATFDSMNKARMRADFNSYIKHSDSMNFYQNGFIADVETFIRDKKYFYGLLGIINSFFIRDNFFDQRKFLFSSLPEKIKNSKLGNDAYQFLVDSEKKSLPDPELRLYNFSLRTTDNKVFKLSKVKNKIIVLDFWASWCSPCIEALPMLKTISRDAVSKDVVFVSVSVDKKVEAWLKRDKTLDIPWTSVIADSNTTASYKIDALPAYIVIDKNGKIVSKGASLLELYRTLQKINNSTGFRSRNTSQDIELVFDEAKNYSQKVNADKINL
jgi:thiol-disulfide isomerase/thioredoxin